MDSCSGQLQGIVYKAQIWFICVMSWVRFDLTFNSNGATIGLDLNGLFQCCSISLDP